VFKGDEVKNFCCNLFNASINSDKDKEKFMDFMNHAGMDSDVLSKDMPKPFGCTVHRLNHTYLYTNRTVADP